MYGLRERTAQLGGGGGGGGGRGGGGGGGGGGGQWAKMNFAGEGKK
jgi:hypothetical protein